MPSEQAKHWLAEMLQGLIVSIRDIELLLLTVLKVLTVFLQGLLSQQNFWSLSLTVASVELPTCAS